MFVSLSKTSSILIEIYKLITWSYSWSRSGRKNHRKNKLFLQNNFLCLPYCLIKWANTHFNNSSCAVRWVTLILKVVIKTVATVHCFKKHKENQGAHTVSWSFLWCRQPAATPGLLSLTHSFWVRYGTSFICFVTVTTNLPGPIWKSNCPCITLEIWPTLLCIII